MLWETVFDVVSLCVSVADVYSDPTDVWAWVGLVGDIVDLVPFVTCVGESVKAVRIVNTVDNFVDGFGGLSRAREFGIKSYTALRKLTKGTDLQAHHIIEKRLVKHLGINTNDMLCVAVTAAEHQKFTNAWREAFKLGTDYHGVTREVLWEKAQIIYKNYPELLDAAEKILFE